MQTHYIQSISEILQFDTTFLRKLKIIRKSKEFEIVTAVMADFE